MKGHFNKPICAIITSLVLVLGTFVLVLPYQEAEAAPIPCDGDIDGGEITGNIVVKGGPICQIKNGAIINGNIKVGKGGNFFCDDSTINGNIMGRGAVNVNIDNCTISGKFSVLNSSDARIRDSLVQGTLTLRNLFFHGLNDSTIDGKSVCVNIGGTFGDGGMMYSNNKGCPGSV